MARIERKYLVHYIQTGDNDYERLGYDLEEFSPELSAQVETKKNILGQTQVMISGYEKTGSVEPYYAYEESELFKRLQNIIDEGLVLDDLRTNVVEVKLWGNKDGGTAYPAVREEAYIEVTSYGGDTTGYQIPFKLHFTGIKQKGTFDIESKQFLPAEV